MRCRDLQELANAPHLRGFLCCALLRVAPYCVPGGVNRGIVTLRSCSLAETHPKYVQHLARLANIQPTLDRYSQCMLSMGHNTTDGVGEVLG